MHFHVKKNHGCPKTTNQKPKITGTYGNVTSPKNPQNQLFSLMNYVHFCKKDLIFRKVWEKFYSKYQFEDHYFWSKSAKRRFKSFQMINGVHFDRKRHVSGNSGRLSNLQKFSVGDSGVVLRQFFADLYFHLYQALALFVDSIMFEIPGSSQPFLLSRIIENGLPPSTA